MANTTLKVYETRTLITKSAFTGSDTIPFQVTSGSRMLVTLLVSAIDPGATVNLFVDNSFASDTNFDTIDSVSLSSTGRLKRIYSDFHNQFNFRVLVTGGNADFIVAITLFDNAGTTRIDNAQISADLDHTTDVLGHFDSVRIGDGTDLLQINPDGSLNVVIGEAPDESIVNEFAETAPIAANAITTILTYAVPAGKELFLSRIDVGGGNIGTYEVFIDGDLIARKRTYFGGNLNETFDFSVSSRRGLPVETGEIITVTVVHDRPFNAVFESRLQGLLKG